MDYALETTLPENVLIGTERRHIRLTERTGFVVLATDEDSATSLINRSFGELAAQNSFTFGADELRRWFQKTSVTRAEAPVGPAFDVIELSSRRLGSITIYGAALTFVGKSLRSFWIETHEGERARVLTGERMNDDEGFRPLPNDFEFTPASVAAAIINQY